MSTEKWTEPDSEAEALAEGFFSQPPAALIDTGAEPWEAAPMSAANRRAMVVTLSLLACCAAAGVGFALLSDHVLVAPARLAGTASHPALATWTAPLTESAPIAAQSAALGAEPEVMAAAMPPTRARETPAPRPAAAAPEAAVRDTEAEQLTQRAYRQLGQGNPREAEQLANLALLQDGSRAETYIVLAGARDALGNAEGARSAMRACAQHARDRLVSTCKTLAR